MIRFSDVTEKGTSPEKLEKHSDIKPLGGMTDQEADAFWKKEFQNAHNEFSQEDYNKAKSEIYNRSEDELNIDFDIDDRFKTILERYSPDKWESLSDTERTEVISDFVRVLGESLKLKELPEIIVYDDQSNSYGYYDSSENTISLNKEYFNDPAELVNTIAHEMRHAYQHYRADLLETYEDLLYKVNLENYISPVELPDGGWLFFTDYQDQYVEVDARAFANLFTEVMKYE